MPIVQHSTTAMTKARIEIYSMGDPEGPGDAYRVSTTEFIVTVQRWFRIAALVSVLGSMPLALLTYPWLPATVAEFVELRHDPAPSGTLSYDQYRAQRLRRVRLALLLYGLGTVSLCGLLAIVADALPPRLELTTWTVIAVTGGAIARFEYPTSAGTDSAYVFMTVSLPRSVAVIAGLAIVLHVVGQRRLASGDYQS